jgi:hypothetical protein
MRNTMPAMMTIPIIDTEKNFQAAIILKIYFSIKLTANALQAAAVRVLADFIFAFLFPFY